ncbi:Mucin-associated surface protein (MASP), putative, partial [Trypanosoma cruzi]
MAMMMTGRVLLVCALCVLWCGAAVAVSSADGGGGGDGSASEYLLLQWRTRLRTECAEEVGRRTGGCENASAVEECVRQVMESLHAVVDGRSRWRRQLSAVAAAAAPVSPAAAEDVKGDANTGKVVGEKNLNTVEDEKTRNNEVSLPRQNNELLVNSGQPATESQKKLPHPETDIVPPPKETSNQGQQNGEKRKEEEEAEENDGESEHEEEDAEDTEEEEEEKEE